MSAIQQTADSFQRSYSFTNLHNLNSLDDIFNDDIEWDECCDNHPIIFVANRNYHNTQSINSLLDTITNKSNVFKFISIQPALKNIDKLRSYLHQLSCASVLIIISETKLKSDQLTMNIEIQGYTFFHSESKSNTGGVGVYV